MYILKTFLFYDVTEAVSQELIFLQVSEIFQKLRIVIEAKPTSGLPRTYNALCDAMYINL